MKIIGIMLLSKLFKSVIFYFVFKVIYRFIKKKSYKYVNIENIDEDDINDDNINEDDINKGNNKNNNKNIFKKNDCSTMILYEPPLKIESRKKYNIKEIYNNFFNCIHVNVKNDINPSHLKNDFKKINKPSIILKEIKQDLIESSLKWTIETKNTYLYKIKTYLKLNRDMLVSNIEISISDCEGNAFIYDYILYNMDNEVGENIYDFSFILDNNAFGENNICIELNLSNNDNNKYKIDEVYIEVIEKHNIDETPILIFDVNERYTPIYFNEKNILDIDELESDDYE